MTTEKKKRVSRCNYCKKELDRKVAYRVDGKPPKFYCNKEEYEKKLINNSYRLQCLDKITELMDYEKGQFLAPMITKRFHKIAEFYPYQIIFITLEHIEKILLMRGSFKDMFESDVQKGSYLCAMIENKINDVYKKYKADEKEREKLLSSIPNSDSTKINEDVNIINDFISDDRPKRKKVKDISSFLD